MVIIFTLVANIYLNNTLERNKTSIVLNQTNENTLPSYIKDMFVFSTDLNEEKWYQSVEVDIFSSASGLLYPGVSGEYEFNVKNDFEKDIKFSISIFESEHETSNIPLIYKIKEENNLVDINWNENLDEFEFLLESSEEKNYTLVWSWPYEGSDEIDTMLGQSDNLFHKINFVIEVESIYEKDN